uniref:Trans-golgi network integral membrane protein tgn38 n=1 Tax=Angiostrongylus cantonensis TaxID=6313 RepID=A0A0K0DCG7_ANGCA
DASIDDGANVSPPADNEAAGEGVAKEDTEPVKGKDKDENQLGAMVEDAKGNVAVPPTSTLIATPYCLQFQPRINFNESEDSYFMTFVVVGGMLVFCVYLLHHNKKKILGLIFEGRASSHSRRNVRYRRLSQREENDKENVGY